MSGAVGRWLGVHPAPPGGPGRAARPRGAGPAAAGLGPGRPRQGLVVGDPRRRHRAGRDQRRSGPSRAARGDRASSTSRSGPACGSSTPSSTSAASTSTRTSGSTWPGATAGRSCSPPGWRRSRRWPSTMRWWPLDELLASSDPLLPVGLRELLPPLIVGDLPRPPIDIGGGAGLPTGEGPGTNLRRPVLNRLERSRRCV